MKYYLFVEVPGIQIHPTPVVDDILFYAIEFDKCSMTEVDNIQGHINIMGRTNFIGRWIIGV